MRRETQRGQTVLEGPNVKQFSNGNANPNPFFPFSKRLVHTAPCSSSLPPHSSPLPFSRLKGVCLFFFVFPSVFVCVRAMRVCVLCVSLATHRAQRWILLENSHHQRFAITSSIPFAPLLPILFAFCCVSFYVRFCPYSYRIYPYVYVLCTEQQGGAYRRVHIISVLL